LEANHDKGSLCPFFGILQRSMFLLSLPCQA
jgi:hypothetical protein